MAEPPGGWTLAGLLRTVRAQLQTAGVANAAFDARLLVEHFTSMGRVDWITDPDRPIGSAQADRILAATARRIAGEPAHRILGFREFHGMRLMLSPGTLEPRPDTETLVELVLPFVREMAALHGGCAILDLGTGTGAIALALLKEESSARAIGVDFSADALATAAENADINGVGDRFSTIRSDWYDGIDGRFHLIVSNPPYIASGEIASLQAEVRDHDPHAALDGGRDGLDAYRRVAAGASPHLAEEGRIAVETGANQRKDVMSIFAEAGLELCHAARDLAGHDRALMFRIA